jgi:ketosteroid isomerase-like protein
MKNRIICLLLVVNSSILFSQVKQTEVNMVVKHMKTQELAWNEADIDGFMKYYWKSDSLKFIGSKGITYGWQKTYDNYVKGYPTKEAMGILTFTIKEAAQLSETSIYVIGQWQLNKEKPAGGYFTLLWKKINNEWVIVADHTS